MLVFTVVVLLDIVFKLLLVIALAKWLMQTVFDFIYNQRILIFGLYKQQRCACELSFQVLNTAKNFQS